MIFKKYYLAFLTTRDILGDLFPAGSTLAESSYSWHTLATVPNSLVVQPRLIPITFSTSQLEVGNGHRILKGMPGHCYFNCSMPSFSTFRRYHNFKRDATGHCNFMWHARSLFF